VSIKTYNYTYDLVENYFLRNLSESDIWVFGSRTNLPDSVASQNTIAETIDVLSRTAFGVKLDVVDYSFMIRGVFWIQDTIYDKYDSNVDLAGKNFYVVIEPESESGSYEMFKCLSNNYGGPSQVKPQSNQSINQIGGVYVLPDGYTWKYMTSIPFAIYKKFATRGYVPIPRNAQVESIADDSLDFIEVLNIDSNAGYQIVEGQVNSKTANGVYLLDITDTFYEAINVYRDSTLYVESEYGGVEIYTILGSRRVGQRLEVTIQGDVYTDFSSTELITVQVLPQIQIRGNGTGAKAIPVFNQAKNRITSIRMLSGGSGYRQAVATVVTPAYFTQLDSRVTNPATLRPIISPLGGHGANVIRELRSNAICLSAAISSSSNTFSSNSEPIIDNGTYSTIALVKNPVFDDGFESSTFDNRLSIELAGSDPTSLLVVGDVVTQTRNGETVSGVIHEISSNNTILLVDYDGPSSIEFEDTAQIVVRNNVYNISEINRSSYEAGTGDVLYITDFLPVERTPDKTEQFKIILEF
jgi:hypothetical protein